MPRRRASGRQPRQAATRRAVVTRLRSTRSGPNPKPNPNRNRNPNPNPTPTPKPNPGQVYQQRLTRQTADVINAMSSAIGNPHAFDALTLSLTLTLTPSLTLTLTLTVTR